MTILETMTYTGDMRIYHENNRLGFSLAASIFIHVAFLVLFAILASRGVKPLTPQAKKIMVELFEGPAMTEPGESSTVTEVAKARPAPPPVKQAPIIKPIPDKVEKTPNQTVIQKKTTVEPNPVEEIPAPMEQAVNKDAAMEEAAREKMRPSASRLIPTYNYLSPQIQENALRDDFAEDSVVSLDTTEFKYLSYFSSLKDKIQMVWKYPQAAKLAGLEGELLLRFKLYSDGTLAEVKIEKSSGIPILDDEAVKAVKKAAPFNAIPKNLGDTLTIVANFEYFLDYYYVR